MRLTLASAALAAVLCGCGAPTQPAPRLPQQPAAQPSPGSPSAAPAVPAVAGSPGPSTIPAGSPSPPAPATTPPAVVDTRLGITGAQTARSLAPDGSAQDPTGAFQSATDRRIVAVIALASLPAGTKISYVRSLDGRFVDSRSAVLAKTSKYAYFEFTALPGKTFTTGHYRLRLYVNEAAAWETGYQVS